MAAVLTRYTAQGVTLLGDRTCPGGVTFGFVERTGGVSVGPYASLNLGDACGDDPALVGENRLRALRALGAEGFADALVNPRQVHGSQVVVVSDASQAALRKAQDEARAGADAVVCTVRGVPVLLCFADCVPLVLVADGAFAVAHSGWPGTFERVGVRALEALCDAASCDPADVRCYVGPCIQGEDYEVSPDMAARFADSFGEEVVVGERNLDLVRAISLSLVGAGMPESNIVSCGISTPRAQERFYSYRAAGGTCGRHGALAWMACGEGE